MTPPAAPPRELAVRSPGPADADALAALVVACERTYLDWAPAGWTVPELPSAWLRRVAEPESWSLCALDDAGTIVGLVCLRPGEMPVPAAPGAPPRAAAPLPGACPPPGGPAPRGVAHVAAMHVHPSHWRRGIATGLLARAEEAMRTRGYGAAELWTPAGAPAERFYAARGWQRDERAVWDGWLGLRMVGYAKRL